MDRGARAIEGVVDEVERARMSEVVLVGERDLHLLGERASLLLAITQERHVVGLAHVEVEVYRAGRDERGEQGGGAGARPAARDQITDGDFVSSDAAREGRGNAGVVEVKPGVVHGGHGIIDSRLRSALLGDLLVGVLDGAGAGLLQGFRARQLAVRETETRAGAFKLRRGLAEFDLIWSRVDQEKQIALVYYIAVLEADL